MNILEPERNTPVVHEADICIVGGSCTGVFAAVQAARLGARVAVIENNGFFGGVATASLVNIWHSLHDINGKAQIIGGLTAEVIERLTSREAVSRGESSCSAYVLNTEELKIELDLLVREANVRPFLHTRFVAPVLEGKRLNAVVVEDKTGRRAIKARYFVDATGDGDVVHRMGFPMSRWGDLQPPTACAVLEGLAEVTRSNPRFNLGEEVFNPTYAEALPRGYLWSSHVTGSEDLTMVAGTRVNGADCSDADDLTEAEIEGRRQVRVIVDILRRHFRGGDKVYLRALPARIGIRETRHASCLHTLTESELLTGKRFADAVANGTYRVDIHHSDKEGITFRYLDGREEYVIPGQPALRGRWLADGEEHAPFYQIPLRSLIPRGSENVFIAGRLMDADRGAYGAVRVMVNCNQTGEAAGVACFLALENSLPVPEVPADKIRAALSKQGAVVL